jgi:serine/threonine protein kinase
VTTSPNFQPYPRPWGPFLLLEALGEGATAHVYRARPEAGGPEVALKLLREHRLLDPRKLERFQREGEIAARLSHPGIVPVRSAGEVDGVPYLAYALVYPAETLEDVLPRLSLSQRVKAIAEVAEALAHAHDKGVVHRDLKPENVLVADGACQIADFGLASVEGLDQLTRTGAAVGTPLFMAPEQLAGERKLLGPHSDVWGLGVMLYQALTGHLPFPGTTFTELMALAEQGPTPPHAVDPEVPKPLSQLCVKTLTFDRQGRPTASAVSLALAAWLRGERLPGLDPQLGARRVAWILAGFAAMGLVAGVAWKAFGPSAASPERATPSPVPDDPPSQTTKTPPTPPTPPTPSGPDPRLPALSEGLELLSGPSPSTRAVTKVLDRLRADAGPGPLIAPRTRELVDLCVAQLLKVVREADWTSDHRTLLVALAQTGFVVGDLTAGNALLDELLFAWRTWKKLSEDDYQSALASLVWLDVVPGRDHVPGGLDPFGPAPELSGYLRALGTWGDRASAAETLEAVESRLGPRTRARAWSLLGGGPGSTAERAERMRWALELSPRDPWVAAAAAEACGLAGSFEEASRTADRVLDILEREGYLQRGLALGHELPDLQARAVWAHLGARELERARAGLARIQASSDHAQEVIADLRPRLDAPPEPPWVPYLDR